MHLSAIALAGALLSGAAVLHAQTNLPGPTAVGIIETRDDRATAAINHKLASIVIPQIEFRSTTLADAIEFLRQESQRLDPDPNGAARGVNIFLQLPAANAATASPSANSRITLALRRIPLLEALKYVASQAGLKVKVEPYAVSIVPLTEETGALITAVFRVPPNFIPNTSTVSGGTALDQPATAAH
jgi:general secretion pathway protein D